VEERSAKSGEMVSGTKR